MQLVENELVNAPNMDVTQWVQTNDQHQNVTKLIMPRDPTIPLNSHQMTPQTSTQQRAMNIHNGGNNEHVQQFDEVVLGQQQWQFVTFGYFIPKTNVPTPTIIFVGLQNNQPNPNIDLVTIGLEMERIQFTNKLEQLHHINRKLPIN
jgi:hypothetical protein